MSRNRKTIGFEQTIKLLKNIDPEEHILLLIGPPGIAKTAVGKEFCERKGIEENRRTTLSIALNETGDIVGFPYKIKSPDGSDTGRMGFSIPTWWPGQVDTKTGKYKPPEALQQPFDDGHEYFLDISEANRGAHREKQAAIINLTLERQIQGRYLPKQTYIVLSVNEGREYMVEDFDPAVRNRLMPVYFEPRVDEWISWFENEEKYYNQFIKSFMRTRNGKAVFIPSKSDIDSGKQFCSPRSLAKLGSFLNSWGADSKKGLYKIAKDQGSFKVMSYGISSLVGERAGNLIVSHLEKAIESESFDYNEIKSEFAKLNRMKNLDKMELSSSINKMKPIEVQNIFSLVESYLHSDEFEGWKYDPKDRALVSMLISRSNIPQEGKLKFLEKIKKRTDTTIFDQDINSIKSKIELVS